MKDLSKIRLIVLDVDGTLTDGGIYYSSDGTESKRFSVKDGLGLRAAKAAGLKLAILTGRVSPMVRRRAEELRFDYLTEGQQKKTEAMKDLMKQAGAGTDEVCYIGDDINDLPCMELAGVKMCPADAAREVREICDFVSSLPGGAGAVRECLEVILLAQGTWESACRSLYFED